MKTYLKLFFAFFKIGAFTFGGGYAMIPIIEKEMVEKRKWISKDDILDIFAISGSTPGAIGLNCSTFVGYRVKGIIGAFCSTLGLILPSFIIIMIISTFIAKFNHISYVQYAFWGIRIGVLSLILKAVISMISACPKNTFTYILMALSFLTAVFFASLNVIYIIVASGIIGVLGSFISYRNGGKIK